jgi:hypothetical protein
MIEGHGERSLETGNTWLGSRALPVASISFEVSCRWGDGSKFSSDSSTVEVIDDVR